MGVKFLEKGEVFFYRGGGVCCQGDGEYIIRVASTFFLHRCGYTLPLPLWEALASGTTDTTVDSILGISHTATNTGKVSLLSIYSVDKCGWLNSQGNRIQLESR